MHVFFIVSGSVCLYLLVYICEYVCRCFFFFFFLVAKQSKSNLAHGFDPALAVNVVVTAQHVFAEVGVFRSMR